MIAAVPVTAIGAWIVHSGDPGGWWIIGLGVLIAVCSLINAFRDG